MSLLGSYWQTPLLYSAHTHRAATVIRKLETSLFYGCFSESVTGELSHHVFSFGEKKVFRHPFVELQPDASHKRDVVLSFQVPTRCRCTWRAIAFRLL